MVNQCLRRHPALVAESHYRYLTRWRTQLAAVQISAIYERCEATFLIFGRFVWIQVILLQFLEVAVKITHAEIDRDVVLVVVSNSNVFVYHAASDSGSFACMTIPPTYSIFGSGMSARSFIFESPRPHPITSNSPGFHVFSNQGCTAGSAGAVCMRKG